MLRQGKRKAPADKGQEMSKLKKFKPIDKIFQSPGSPKSNSVAKAKISQLLPDGYRSIIISASMKVEENAEANEGIFGCVRLPIASKEDGLLWLKKFERKTHTSYRAQKTWKTDPQTGLDKRKFLCNHHNEGLSTCKACVIFSIKGAKEIQANPDYRLKNYRSEVIIRFCHNHKIDTDAYLKNVHQSAELRVIFHSYFADGHSPFSALICHKCDLHSFYGSEFYNALSTGNVCPSYSWCSREFENIFGQEFVDPDENKLKQMLKDAVTKYNMKCLSECSILAAESPLVLSICSPLMKSIFRSGFAEDLITVRTFYIPKTTPKRQKLILFLCHTPIGSLPFGIVVTLAEDVPSLCRGIRSILLMLGVPSYSPKTIVADENSLVSKSLRKNFPASKVIHNEFQMLQSIWRVIRLVWQDDSEELSTVYNLFLLTLNSDSEEIFKDNFKRLEMYAKKNPKLVNFLKYFKFRSKSYVLYARPKVEFNTDILNYTDSGTIILQDVSIKYSKFFNILQLFDFLTKSYVNHYERKLSKIVEGDLKGFFKTNFFVPLNKISDFTCEKITDTEFLVTINNVKFFVNAELDTCTCQVAVYGGSCVHQYIVEKNLGLVPECYTPLGDDMLDIFKSILSVTGTISDTHDLGPIGETSTISDSFPDEEVSEFEDLNEDNDEFLNDPGQYNRESGELEPIESPLTSQRLINDSSQKNRSAYEAMIPSLNVNSIVITTDIGEYNIVDNTVLTEIDRPLVYTYATENEDHIIYEEVITESDEKTAEIAEFLTSLPDTHNFNCSASDSVESSVDSEPTKEATEVLQSPEQKRGVEFASEGVVVMKNDEYFTQYRVMENGVLSVVADTDGQQGYQNQINSFETASEQNFMQDSYEENNFIMMSPADLFDDNENLGDTNRADSKVNVLSSVIIKPPFNKNIPMSRFSVDLDIVKNKTLRNAKELDSDRTLSETEHATEEQYQVPGKKGDDYSKLDVNVCEKENVCQNLLPVNVQTDVNALEYTDFTECDPAQLAEECLGVIEIDSDGLEELASQHYDLSADKSLPPLNMVPLRQVPPEFSPKKSSTLTGKFAEATSIPLREFLANHRVSNKKQQSTTMSVCSEAEKQTSPYKHQEEKSKTHSKKENGFLEVQLITAFSQLTDLANKNNFKGSVEKFLDKFKELGNSENLIKALENFGTGVTPAKKTSEVANARSISAEECREVTDDLVSSHNDTEEIDVLTDSDDTHSTEFEHYSDCKTSCSEFHSELEDVFDLSDYEIYELGLSDEDSKVSSNKNDSEVVRKFHSHHKNEEFDSDSSDEFMWDVQNKNRGLSNPFRKKAKNRNRFRFVDDDSDLSTDNEISSSSVSNEVWENQGEKTPDKCTASKANLVPAGEEFKLRKNVLDSNVQEPALSVQRNGISISSNSVNNMMKDAKELKAILMGTGHTHNNEPKVSLTETSVLENEELSFLFKDPRFEAVIVEDPENDEPTEGANPISNIKYENIQLPPVVYSTPEIIITPKSPKTVSGIGKQVSKTDKRIKKIVRPERKVSNRYLSKELEELKKTADKFTKGEDQANVSVCRRSPRNLTTDTKTLTILDSIRKENKLSGNKRDAPNITPESENQFEIRKRGRKRKVDPTKAVKPTETTLTQDDSLDFENSIGTSILKKTPGTKTSNQSMLNQLATPITPARYEDAFRQFLETSSTKIKKNFGCHDYDKSNSHVGESHGPSQATEFGSKTPNTSKIKKSVSWADGLDIMEYVMESESNSSDSEIRITKLSKTYRNQGKNRPEYKEPPLELIVLLERNIDIEFRCQRLRASRSERGQRRGYKELLERARLLKNF